MGMLVMAKQMARLMEKYTFSRIWLLECNGSPACAQRLLEDFAQEVVNVAINHYFPPGEEPVEPSRQKPTVSRGGFTLIGRMTSNDS
eukprot:scaffold79502_cov19-Prasinocladus_malaysianus.AAC.2